MCLAIPGRVVGIVDDDNRLAKVDVSGVLRNVNVGLLDGVADEVGHHLRGAADGDSVGANLRHPHRHGLIGARDAVVVVAGAHSMTLVLRSSSSCS